MSDLRKFKGKVRLETETASRVATIDSNKEITSSSVTTTELGHVSGVTSAIQGQIDAKASQADLTAHISNATAAHAATAISVTPSGNLVSTEVQAAFDELQGDIDGISAIGADLVTLTGVLVNSTNLGTFTGTTIPDSSTIKAALQSLETFIEAIPSPFFYAGVWAASTNTPALADGAGTSGSVYYVTDSGTVNFGAGAQVFNAGDKVAYNGTTWDKWDMTDAVTSVNSQTGVVVLTTANVADSTNARYVTDAQLVIVGNTSGTNSGDVTVTDTATVNLTLTAQDISADVISQMSITSDASGLKLSGDAASPGNTKYYGTDGAGTKGFFTIPATGVSAGDIVETSFSLANNQVAPANVTGFLFPVGTVRSFSSLTSVEIDATADLYEQFTLQGINKAVSFNMSVDSTGDASGIVFSITSSGQVQYTSAAYAGFVSGLIKFRAITTSV